MYVAITKLRYVPARRDVLVPANTDLTASSPTFLHGCYPLARYPVRQASADMVEAAGHDVRIARPVQDAMQARLIDEGTSDLCLGHLHDAWSKEQPRLPYNRPMPVMAMI